MRRNRGNERVSYPAARIGDPVTHDGVTPCGTVGPPMTPAVDAPVLIEGLPAAHVGCTVLCSGATSAGPAHPPPAVGAPPVPIVLGSSGVFIHGKPAARWVPGPDFAFCSAQIGNLALALTRSVWIGDGVPSEEASASPGQLFTLDDKGNLRVNEAITVVGSPEFKAAAQEALTKIYSTKAGRQVIESIGQSGKKVAISETSSVDDSPAYSLALSDADAAKPGTPVLDYKGQQMRNLAGEPIVATGKGSHAELRWDPTFELENPAAPDHPMPNDAVIFHELTHSDRQVHGTVDSTPKEGWDSREEETAISTGTPSETDYLRERGYPWRRTNHGTGFVPNQASGGGSP